MQLKMQPVKCVLIGSGGCGKTTLLQRLQGGEFDKRYIATLGVEVHPVRVAEAKVINVWDCAGQERFGGLRAGYWVAANVVILAFDLSSEQSLKEVCSYDGQLDESVERIFVGTKADLETPEMEAKVRAIWGGTLIKTSAKTGEGLGALVALLQ